MFLKLTDNEIFDFTRFLGKRRSSSEQYQFLLFVDKDDTDLAYPVQISKQGDTMLSSAGVKLTGVHTMNTFGGDRKRSKSRCLWNTPSIFDHFNSHFTI